MAGVQAHIDAGIVMWNTVLAVAVKNILVMKIVGFVRLMNRNANRAGTVSLLTRKMMMAAKRACSLH